MKNLNFLSVIVKIGLCITLVTIFSSCDTCGDTECFTPAEPFYFQLIDKETNENLLENGTYLLSDVRIKSLARNELHLLELDSVEINGQKELVLMDAEIGWEPNRENKNYTLILADSLEFDFVYETEERKGECCTFYDVMEVSSSDMEINKTDSEFGFLYKLGL
ncbi:hypothetical protein [Bernardetia sp.]|uniref:hypothetical protein n=1 Tax=Bernardetia sp. TaxID=1937974 RepID=UPI0025BED757|nr:hypothetical protein [Bernardetia sp.]